MGHTDEGGTLNNSGVLLPTGQRREQLGAAADLERGLAALKSKQLAAAQMHLTEAQHAVFAAFLREVTLQSFGLSE